MKQKCNNDSIQYILMERNTEKNSIQRHPLYPVGDDVLNKHHEKTNMSRQTPSIIVAPNNNLDVGEGNHIDDIVPGDNLNIRNIGMDNVQLNIRSEFEENNYYSLWS